MPDVEVIL